MTVYYTKDQLIKKFKGKFINVYAHGHTLWNDKTNRYETVFEVTGKSNTVKENFETPEDIIERFK